MTTSRLLRPLLIATAALALVAVASSAHAADDEAELAERLRAIPAPLVEAGVVPSMVIGVIDGDRRAVVGVGSLRRGGKVGVNGDTPYQIGSVTKVFTGVLLADLARRKRVALDAPLRTHAPEGVLSGEPAAQEIRLVDLATHRSGLPRMPDDFAPKDPGDPYADYDAARVWAFVARHGLTRPTDAPYAYSNVGMGALGLALASAGGAPYAEQVRTRVLEPLGMRRTSFAVVADDLPDAVDGDGLPARPWHLTGMEAAGALVSTTNDLLTFAAAQWSVPKTAAGEDLASTLAFAREPRTEAQDGVRMGLGWHVRASDGLLFHSGETGGFHSVLTVDVARRRAVVVLASAAGDAGEQVASRVVTLLDGGTPTPIPVRTAIDVAPEVLDTYTGRYELAPGMAAEVTRVDGALFVQVSGQPRFRLFASAPQRFFLRVVEAEITFVGDGKAPAPSLVLHQNGRDVPARRVAAKPARITVDVPVATLERYVGVYEGQGLTVTVTRDGGALFVQLTAQPRFPVYATSLTRFEYDVVEAALTFEGETDGDAPATAVSLEQGGRTLRFERRGSPR